MLYNPEQEYLCYLAIGTRGDVAMALFAAGALGLALVRYRKTAA